MIKVPSKQHITDLAGLLRQHHVRHVVICPGSRNAPLIQAFQRDESFQCFSIVDERSAGYIALGMAKQSGQPAVVITTSGTAVLNLAPAVAEAYNQRIPLIVLTGDRPEEFPPQFTNQRINQADVFAPNAVGSYQFGPEFKNRKALERCMLNAAEVLRNGCLKNPGPVHFNFVLHEPLYEVVPLHLMTKIRIEDPRDAHVDSLFSDIDQSLIREHLSSQKKVLIIAGMANYGESSQKALEEIAARHQVAVIAENIANLHGPYVISTPELVLAAARGQEVKNLLPDLVIAIGGPVVSKRTRLFVQGLKDIPVLALEGNPETILHLIHDGVSAGDKINNDYGKHWKSMEQSGADIAEGYLEAAAFSNLTVIHKIINKIAPGTIVHLGNSGVVRYSQLFPARADLFHFGNRGTSGIDGSLSTAVGAAMVSESNHLVILGDLSFMYDSNALWNKNFPSNLKIIILNDKGGGIFRLLDGPDRMSFFREFSVTDHPFETEHIFRAFGMNILTANSDNTLEEGLDTLFDHRSYITALEVNTSGSENSGIFKEFYKSIHNQ